MVQLETIPLWVPAAGAGLLLHVAAFRVGEWDSSLHKAAGLYGALAVGGSAYVHFVSSNGTIGLAEAFRTITYLELVSILAIFASMSVYRVFFHRLRKFPGPIGARISNLYTISLTTKNFHLYEEIEELHKKHGDFVRIAPQEISINNVDAVAKLHSAMAKCTKGPWYSMRTYFSLQTTRNKAEHARRRKVWDRGFNAKALRDYEPRVSKYTDQLMSQIDKHAGKPINATDWFNFYSFDVMGDLAFGTNFDMLQEGIKHYFMTQLHGFMEMVGILSYAPWVVRVLTAVPVVNNDDKKFWNWLTEQVEKRRKNPPSQPDVFSWIIEEYESIKQPTHQDYIDLVADAQLIAVAGSDTTAATLSTLFYELAQHPEVVEKLQKEIDGAFEKGEVDYTGLSKQPYLQACVDEAMRLHPAVPSGLQRVTPPQGIEVDGTYIPGNTFVKIPIHTLQRDPRYYERPEEFIPERWTTKPDLVKNAAAFMPFSLGPYGCVGKHLGLMEIRAVTAHILHNYNVKLAPGYSPSTFLAGKKDCFTLALGPLDLLFDARK